MKRGQRTYMYEGEGDSSLISVNEEILKIHLQVQKTLGLLRNGFQMILRFCSMQG